MKKKYNIIYGIRSVIESLSSGRHLERIFVQKNLKGELYRELMRWVDLSETPLSKVPIERLNKFTQKNHQGVVALVSPIEYHKLDNLVPSLFEQGYLPLLIILDGITDVRNFGAIARTAECMGVHGLVIPLSGSVQINEDSVKTSSGAFNYIPVCRQKKLLDAVDYLQKSGFSIFGCTEKAEKKLEQVDFTVPLALILGSEELGISNELIQRSDELVGISMTGNISSLNVSVATGMVLYEVLRQRN